MNLKLIGENNYRDDPIGTIFRNRGVENIDNLLNLDESCIIPYSNLSNIDKAVECTLKHINGNNKIFIQVDSDCDGFCSSSILINYLNSIFPNVRIEWRLQEGKQHGIDVHDVPDDTNLVILPDSGSNQYEEHLNLKNRGMDVIVLDHHKCDKESENAIVVNNQLSPNYHNKDFAASGIVYKFCQAIDDKLNVNKADEYLDLVAVGNIGDMMDLRTLETRYYVKKGLQQIRNPLLQAIIEKQYFSMKGIVNIHNVAFFVVPLINAAVRTATLSEKTEMMISFLGSKETRYYKRNDVYESIQVTVARNLTNIRNRQNTSRDKGFIPLEKQIYDKNLIENKVLVLDVTDVLDENLTGLIANKISQKYKRPSILLRKKKDDVYGGSARGFSGGEIKDFRDFLLQSGLFSLCEGHDNAFGVEIKESNLEELHNYFNENLKEEIDIDCIEVDFVIDGKDIDAYLIANISKYRDEWGSYLTEPKVGILNLSFEKDDIDLTGKKKNTLKLIHNDIEFIKFFFKKDQFEEMFGNGETFYIDIVGKCKLNKWDGNEIAQIEIEEIEVVDSFDF